jgi:hypothetical protein
MSENKICKFFLKNNCDKGNTCKFVHDKDICCNYFFDGKCKRKDNCKFKHDITITKKHYKNTENFNPSFELPDMNIIVGNSNNETYKNKLGDRDVIIVPEFIKEENSGEIYNKLLKEIEDFGINEKELWKLWHGDTHLIADDNMSWKGKTPTFNFIIEKISLYFNIDVKSTRLNLYKNSNDWKPYHHDAAAFKDNIAKIQNFTIGVSFGATRSISFEHAKSKNIVAIPLENSSAYGFGKDVNIIWKHGIPQIEKDKEFNEGRISIIVWGMLK